MRKLKKILLIFGIIVTIIVVVVIAFISPITKYAVEKYDKKYTGRRITMDWAYVNPFTGYVHFKNLKIYEFKSDSVFFSANAVSAHFAMLKMLSKTYEISDLSIDHPHGIIIQNKKEVNINDLIEKFSSKNKSGRNQSPVHFNILNIKINDGEFYYQEKQIPINYFLKKVNFESTGKRWDEDTIAAVFSFDSGLGKGDMKGYFTINFKNQGYRVAAVAKKFDLQIIEQYLQDL